MTSAKDLIARTFGGLTDPGQPATKTATTSRAEIFTRDPMRVQLTIVNYGPSHIYVTEGEDLDNTTGVRLNPGGSVMTLDVREDASRVNGEFYVHTTTGVSSIGFSQVILV